MKHYVLIIAYFLFTASCSDGGSQTDNLNTSIFWVNSVKVPCEGVAPMQCLQIKKDENEAWQYFYSQIHGFDFEPGYLYKLEVQEEKLDPSQLPQDVSSIKYSLLSVLAKTEDPFFGLYGTYVGTLPCADCEGIKTILTLSEGDIYMRNLQYLGKQQDAFNQKGNFELDRKTSVISLSLEDGGLQQYQLEENALFHLDQQGARVEGDLAELYKLNKKMSDKQLENQEWILTHLMGQQVVLATGNTDASIFFDSKEGRAGGSTSCNRYNCTYELLPSNRIKIAPGMTTLMACENMETEKQYNQMLPKADSYKVSENVLSFMDTANTTIAQYRLAKEGE